MKSLSRFAKITPPSVKGVYQRTRLFQRLDELRDSALIWVTGPAGSGKTTLLASYLAATKMPAIWYRLDEGDTDLSSFFYYLGLAAKESVSSGPPLPLLTPDYLADIKTFSRNYFRRFFQIVGSHSVLVLDNYQDLPADTQLHEILAIACEELPQDQNIVVLSRSGPPPPYARLFLDLSAEEIAPDELILSPEETEEVCYFFHPQIKKEEIDKIFRITAGWFAGISLMLQHQHHGEPDLLPAESHYNQRVFDYLANEIFQRCDTATRDFLMRLSLFPEVPAEAAGEITESPQADETLEKLYQQNFFITRHQRNTATYTLHPLFRSFLLEQLQKAMSPQELHALKQRAADILLARNGHEIAIDLLCEIEDWETLATIICDHASEMIAQGRYRTLETWIECLPEKVRDSNAWITYWRGMCSLPVSPVSSMKLFQNAYHLFDRQANSKGALLAWSGVVDACVFSWADMTPLDEWISLMETRLQEALAKSDDETRLRVNCSLLTALMYRQPSHPRLVELLEQAKQIILSTAPSGLRVYIGSQLLLYDTWWTGDLARARLLLETLEPMANSPDVEPLVTITWHMMSAAFFWMTAQNNQSLDSADKGIELANSNGVHAIDVMLNCQALFATLSDEDTDRAETYFSNIRQAIIPERFLDNAMYHHLRAWYRVLQGRFHEARAHAEESLQMAKNAGSPWFLAHAFNFYSLSLHLIGESSSALDLLRKTRDEYSALRSATFDYLTWLIEAEILCEQDDEHDGLVALEKSLDVASRCGFVNHAWWRSEAMSHLYAKALARGIATEYVRAQIGLRDLIPQKLSEAERDVWPWKVRIYTLGRFEIYLQDVPLEFGGKAQKKPLELLKALIALGEVDVRTENLEEILWPEADGDTAQQNLKATLHRLRKLVGRDAIRLQDNRMSLNPNLCWTDIHSLKHWLQEGAKLQEEKPDIKASSEILARLISLYQGLFLSGEEASWLIVPREMLHGKFMRITLQLADALYRLGKIETALQAYLQLMDLEPLREELYLAAMNCYKELGKADAASVIHSQLERIRDHQAGDPQCPE